MFTKQVNIYYEADMNVTFSSRKLQKLCNSEKKLKGEYGIRMANKIMARLADLAAADNLAVMKQLPGRCHELAENWLGHLALDLVHPQRLIFRPDHEPLPKTDEGNLIWEAVTQVTIAAIRNYH